ncbi:MAG: hypothetical protein ACXWDM_00505 [Nocardioides sp.]
MSSVEPFTVPVGWRRSRRGDVVVATRPGPSAARLEWRTGSLPVYDAPVVEDEDSFELSGHPVDYRRLGHRAGGVELVSEEWTWWVDGERLVLTGTVPRDDYLSVCDLFEDVAATVEVGVPQG